MNHYRNSPSTRQSIRRGELVDPHPDLTARFILTFARTAMLSKSAIGDEAMINHMLRVIGHRVLRKETV